MHAVTQRQHVNPSCSKRAGCDHADAMAAGERKKKGACTHGATGVSETELHGDSNRAGGRKACGSPATAGLFPRVQCLWRRRRMLGRSSENRILGAFRQSTQVKEGHCVAGSKLGIGCPAVAIELGAWLRRARMQICSVADSISSRIWRSVSTPLSLPSEIMSRLSVPLPFNMARTTIVLYQLQR